MRKFEFIAVMHAFDNCRFSVGQTRYVFLLAFAIPASLWVLSCSCLFGCSKVLRVEENGQMRIRCRKKLHTEEADVEMIPLRSIRKKGSRRFKRGSGSTSSYKVAQA